MDIERESDQKNEFVEISDTTFLPQPERIELVSVIAGMALITLQESLK